MTDTNLRLYLAALRGAQELARLARRGRPRAAYELGQWRWPAWRGRAVEPLVREALERVSGGLPWPEPAVVGGWWNRQLAPEVDLVGADRGPVAQRIHFAGSIKWLGTPFDRHDFAALSRDAVQIPGFVPGETGLVAVSRSGVSAGGQVDLSWGPAEVPAAWEADRPARYAEELDQEGGP